MKKTAILITVTAMISLSALAQAPADSLYIVTYTTGSQWDQGKASGEQPYFKEHGARLGQLRRDGIIKFGARYGEKGVIVISASNTAAAKEIVFADQAVTNKLFTAEVQKLKIFYDGCLERPK